MATTALISTGNLQQRQSANYDPSVWGDFFVTYACDNKNVRVWLEEAEMLKEKVQKMLKDDFTIEHLSEKLSIIDAVERLGIAYHFETEIRDMLQRVYDLFNEEINLEHYELVTLALLFRLLRQHGYNVSTDIFNKFSGNKDGFKDFVTEDIEGMLCLYEAAHLRLRGEPILEKALAFTKNALELKLPSLGPSQAGRVSHTFRWPVQKCLPRVGARKYISLYQEIELHNEVLLKFAKLDFNLLQLQHQEELSFITKWWKDLDVKNKLPYARDRITECYFWILGVYYEPQYALARKFAVKVIALTSVLDDTYDVYGTYKELERLTHAFERWDIHVMDELPEYMKTIYQAMLEIYSEMEEEMVKRGRSYAICYAKEAMKRLLKAYLEEAKWLVEKKVPRMEEYLRVALPSTAYPMLSVISLVGMEEVATEDAFLWLLSEPPLQHSICCICRFMDDIVSRELEQKREHIPSAVDCYMKEYKVTASEACEVLSIEVENAWKDINQAFLDPKAPSMPILMRILNLVRVIELLYTGEDMYTHSHKMKPLVDSLLLNPLQIV
ncbi:(-)-germacrene D synthase-like [Silene latifolia]|uniref:(-)-germacrene D synthase-like n=1 Tax=Silene latifolia TaxID=37657 RepID=UPI003D770711